jgi:hypothetical protein
MIPNSCLSRAVGRPFANAICIILVIMRMRALAEKRKELPQTIASLIGSLRTEKGCRRRQGHLGSALFERSSLTPNILEEFMKRKLLKVPIASLQRGK